MIVLDRNIPRDHVAALRSWRLRFEQIGFEVGRAEWDDQQQIIPYLHGLKQSTFFTRDGGFFRPHLRHSNYCLVVIDENERETANFIRRFLRHPKFKTKAQRCGKVMRLSPRMISWWEIGVGQQKTMLW